MTHYRLRRGLKRGCGNYSCRLCYIKVSVKKKKPKIVDVGDHQEAGKRVLAALLGETEVKTVKVQLVETRHGQAREGAGSKGGAIR